MNKVDPPFAKTCSLISREGEFSSRNIKLCRRVIGSKFRSSCCDMHAKRKREGGRKEGTARRHRN